MYTTICESLENYKIMNCILLCILINKLHNLHFLTFDGFSVCSRKSTNLYNSYRKNHCCTTFYSDSV